MTQDALRKEIQTRTRELEELTARAQKSSLELEQLTKMLSEVSPDVPPIIHVDAPGQFVTVAGQTWTLACPAKWSGSWKFSFVRSPHFQGRCLTDGQHHGPEIHYLPGPGLIMVRHIAWGVPYEGLPRATGPETDVYYSLDGTFAREREHPSVSSLGEARFVYGDSQMAVVRGETLAIYSFGVHIHTFALPSIGCVTAGCQTGVDGTIALAVGAQVHLLRLSGSDYVKALSWDLPTDVIQLVPGPVARTKTSIFRLRESGRTLIDYGSPKGIFACPHTGQIYSS